MTGGAGGPPVCERAGGGGPERLRATGEEATDDPREEVAGPGRRQPRSAGGVDRGAARAVGDHLPRAFQQDDGVRPLGQSARRRQPVGAHLLARQVHVFARVRGEDGRRAASPQRSDGAGQGGEPVGVEDERDGRSGSWSARSRSSGTNPDGPPRSMPMSATSTSPAWPAPGWNTSPGLSAENVTVCEACTASPSTAPVRPFTPDGMSTATHGPSTASTASATHAASPSSAPRNPVPNMASTNASARSRARSQSWRSTPASSVNTSTRTPHSRRARAVTSPSPPLLPLPHTTTTRRPYVPPISRRTVHATARPARSLSTSTR